MLASTLFVLIALLNLLPGIVAFRAARTKSLYGFATEGAAMELAMRHRAVLLALVGLLLGLAAYDDAWRRPALLVAGVSKGSFLLLFALTGPHEAPMRRVALPDIVALFMLGVAAAA